MGGGVAQHILKVPISGDITLVRVESDRAEQEHFVCVRLFV